MNEILQQQMHAIGQTSLHSTPPPAPALYLHCAVVTAGGHILSDETFRAVSFEGQEGVSEPFEYQLELHGNTSASHGTPLAFADMMGRPVTVGIARPSSHSPAQMSHRFARAVRGAGAGAELSLFNGIVASFSMEQPGVYKLGMKPALWQLSLTNRYQIHRQKNVRDTIAEVLERHRVGYSMDAVSGDDNPAISRIQDWLQAGESDLEFVQRLMGKAHLFYYFVHSGNSHKLVFVNRTSYSYPAVLSDQRRLRYTATDADALGLSQSDVIGQYSIERALVSSGVRSVFTRQESAWEDDAVAHFQSYRADSRTDIGELPFHQYKIFQYGGSTEEARHLNDSAAQALATSACRFSGISNCAHFRVGHQFGTTGADNAPSRPWQVQPSLEGRDFVLTQVKHQASADGGYTNQFSATQADGFIAPFSLQETQQGALVAKVVTKGGDESQQDWRYYTNDYFDPDTSDLTDQAGVQRTVKAQGVYVRFSNAPENSPPVWVKLAPSMQTVPEIGVTVIIARAQDESELPEVQNIIQANGGMVIMPSKWTANTHVGSNYSTSYGDGQSIRFGTRSNGDVKRAFSITDNAYKSDQYRDTGYSQGAGYNFSCADSLATTYAPDDGELFGPYKGATDLLNASESFGSSYNRQYAQVSSSFSKIGTSYSHSTIGINESHTIINGVTTSETTHNDAIHSTTTINAESVNTTTQTGDSTSTSTITGASASTATYHGTLSSTADHYGAVSSTTHHHDDVNSTNIVDGTAKSTNMNNIVINLSSTAVQTNSSATGVANSNDVTGVANRNNAVGASVDLNVAASSNSINAVGAHTAINMTGASVNVELAGPGYSFSNRTGNPRVETIDLRLTLVEIMQIYL